MTVLCDVMGIGTTTYYDWLGRGATETELRDAYAANELFDMWQRSAQTYGYRRLRRQLARKGERVNDKRVRRLMGLCGIQGHVPRLKRRIYQVAAEGVHAPDLVRRDWNPTQPNKLWVADITYIRTWQGWLYLAVIMDACSRRIVGWSMQPHMRTELVQAALDMAVARRRPAAGLVHHTDHGSQGEFNWSLQHHNYGGCDGQASRVDDRANGQVSDEVTWRAVAAARGRARVLGSGCEGDHERGCRGLCRGFTSGRDALVSRGWGHVTLWKRQHLGPIPVLR